MILNGKSIWKLVIILSLLIPKVYSQSEIESLSDPIRQYAGPVIEGTVGNLSSGWMQRSPRAKMLGLDVEFGIIGMGTVFGQRDKTFSSNVNVKLTEATINVIVSNISDPQLREAVKESLRDAKLRVTVSGPTVLGSNTETIRFHYPGDTISFSYAGQYHTVALKEVYEDTKITGINFPLVPLGALQGSIGTFAGTKLLLRTIPPIDLGSNNGKIFYIGGGLQHNPMVWFSKKPPIDASVGFIIYRMNVGSVFKSFGMQTGLSVSKTFGMTMLEFTPFLGFNIDYNKSKIHYLYEYTDEAGQRQSYLLDLDLHEHTGVRFNTGFELKAAIMNFSFNYSYEKYHSFSGGIGFIF